MYTIKKEIILSCAHHLPNHPKCGVLHGHDYKVVCTFKQADRYFNGEMVIDFALPEVKQFDHTDLNKVMDYPSAENFSKLIFDKLGKDIVKVEVWETPTGYASYER